MDFDEKASRSSYINRKSITIKLVKRRAS